MWGAHPAVLGAQSCLLWDHTPCAACLARPVLLVKEVDSGPSSSKCYLVGLIHTCRRLRDVPRQGICPAERWVSECREGPAAPRGTATRKDHHRRLPALSTAGGVHAGLSYGEETLPRSLFKSSHRELVTKLCAVGFPSISGPGPYQALCFLDLSLVRSPGRGGGRVLGPILSDGFSCRCHSALAPHPHPLVASFAQHLEQGTAGWRGARSCGGQWILVSRPQAAAAGLPQGRGLQHGRLFLQGRWNL